MLIQFKIISRKGSVRLLGRMGKGEGGREGGRDYFFERYSDNVHLRCEWGGERGMKFECTLFNCLKNNKSQVIFRCRAFVAFQDFIRKSISYLDFSPLSIFTTFLCVCFRFTFLLFLLLLFASSFCCRVVTSFTLLLFLLLFLSSIILRDFISPPSFSHLFTRHAHTQAYTHLLPPFLPPHLKNKPSLPPSLPPSSRQHPR